MIARIDGRHKPCKFRAADAALRLVGLMPYERFPDAALRDSAAS
jgi:hypothetical protein